MVAVFLLIYGSRTNGAVQEAPRIIIRYRAFRPVGNADCETLTTRRIGWAGGLGKTRPEHTRLSLSPSNKKSHSYSRWRFVALVAGLTSQQR